MKTILLSLLLIVSSMSHAYTYNLDADNISFKEDSLQTLSEIYHSCVALTTSGAIVKDIKGRILEREKVIIGTELAKKYIFTLCMTGNYDIQYNNLVKEIRNMKEDI